jgi:hypothetical protein
VKRDVGAAAREQAQRAKEEGRRLGRDAQMRARGVVERWRQGMADRVGTVARALHRTADELGDEREETVAGYFERAADGLDDVSHRLHDEDFGALIDETESFARRHPGVFLGGSVLAGFLLARFVRSSTASQEAAAAASPRPGGEPATRRPRGYSVGDAAPPVPPNVPGGPPGAAGRAR